MSFDVFRRFAPFIQDYIRREGWQELRPVQIAASNVLFDSDNHLLLAAGTAAGKTEAAFLPILTLLQQRPARSIGVLYIGPLKALINDQFERLNHLLLEGRVPVHAWHGDVAQSRKTQTLKHPTGILQITPESMEGMFVYRTNQLYRLFADLQFIVIDEVHAFMASERGRQVLCQLERLRPYMTREPRRVGLSATLGDYSQAELWLSSGTARSVSTPQVHQASRTVRLSVDQFTVEAKKDQSTTAEPTPLGDGSPAETKEEARRQSDRFDQYLWNETICCNKVLIFANSRADTEKSVANLRAMARRKKMPDNYFVHHGNIAKSLREEAELAMKDDQRPAVTAATVTLELGIDIGQLDRVLQLGSPRAVGSFVQRLGRSGRRGGPAEMFISICEEEPVQSEEWPKQLPWELLQAIAVIQLYLEERWVEPADHKPYPFSLLYHQTMSTLASLGELTPRELAGRVLGLTPFKEIQAEDYRTFLLHLLETDQLEKTPEGGLIVGVSGEQIVNHYSFLAVFHDAETYSVKDGSKEIGSIDGPVPVGERFRLAGRTWQVKEIDSTRRTIYVFGVQGKATISWLGESGPIHTKVLQRMRRALLEQIEYPYLQEHAKERLTQGRQLAISIGLEKSDVLPLARDSYCLLPWVGTRGFVTLQGLLAAGFVGDTAPTGMTQPYYLEIRTSGSSPSQLKKSLKSLCDRKLDALDLVKASPRPELDRYDEHVPVDQLRLAYAHNYLDIEGMQAAMRILK